jgi:Tol biopolymer transport system component
MFGRVTGSSATTSSDPALVVVPVDQKGAAGTPTVIGLDGFRVTGGFDPHPCAIWAPDGRWVAFAGAGQVWVVDTKTRAVRQLPGLRPSDLEWRPGTDQLAIAGDIGTSRQAPVLSAPVSIYSVSTGKLRRLGSVQAAHLTWSPDGATLAYMGSEADHPALGLVDGDGANQRMLDADAGSRSDHGIGPVWSPRGDRIAYQRRVGCCEGSEVVLVNVADGTKTVIAALKTDVRVWWPFTVSWSPDGKTLLYSGWTEDDLSLPGGVIAVAADGSGEATLLTDAIAPVPNYYSHQWAVVQMWGRQPG